MEAIYEDGFGSNFVDKPKQLISMQNDSIRGGKVLLQSSTRKNSHRQNKGFHCNKWTGISNCMFLGFSGLNYGICLHFLIVMFLEKRACLNNNYWPRMKRGCFSLKHCPIQTSIKQTPTTLSISRSAVPFKSPTQLRFQITSLSLCLFNYRIWKL